MLVQDDVYVLSNFKVYSDLLFFDRVTVKAKNCVHLATKLIISGFGEQSENS